MVGETQVGVGESLVRTANVAVHTVQSVISPCREVNILVKAGESVCQFYVIEVSCNHIKGVHSPPLADASGQSGHQTELPHNPTL